MTVRLESETVIDQKPEIDIDQPPKRQDGQIFEEWVKEAAHWAQQQVDKRAPSDLLGS